MILRALSEMQKAWVKDKVEDLRPVAMNNKCGSIHRLADENDWTDIVQNGNEG